MTATRATTAAILVALAAACGGQSQTEPPVPTQPTPDSTPPGGAATYRLTFTADAACTALPAAVRTRTYSTQFAPDAPHQVVTLTGAEFVSAGYGYGAANVIYLSVRQPDKVASLYFSDPPIVELVTRTSSMFIEGYSEGVIGNAISEFSARGTLLFCGDRAYSAGYGACRIPMVRCESSNHRLTLARQ